MDYVNEERADRAQLAITPATVNLEVLDGTGELTEHLHNLMHWATREGVAFSTCMGLAREAWKAEVKPKRQGVSHPIDTTELRAVDQSGTVHLPCIHGKMPNERCTECQIATQAQRAKRWIMKPWKVATASFVVIFGLSVLGAVLINLFWR